MSKMTLQTIATHSRNPIDGKVSSKRPSKASRRRLAALALALSGILFVLYPAIRPFSDESSLQGAAAFASLSWVLAHTLGMMAFLLLMLGLFGLYLRLQETTVERITLPALILSWIGVGLTLPYYGAETFGLHALGQEALKEHNATLVSLANAVRMEQGAVFIVAGLFLLTIGIILFAIAVWRSGGFLRWSAIPLAVGLALYLPQYFTPQFIRVSHGLFIMIACMLLAWSTWKRNQDA